MSTDAKFQLDIQWVKGICLFKLSWGKNQYLNASVIYPKILTTLYQDWQRAYLSFYNNVEIRGRSIIEGTLALTEADWGIKVERAEAELLDEFNEWLRSGELYKIREKIVESAKSLVPLNGSTDSLGWVDVFISCAVVNPPSEKEKQESLDVELESLPWEAWEWENRAKIRIARSPVNIRHEPMRPRQGRPRILVVLGDDTGLNFNAELEAVEKQLKPLAEVRHIGWKHSSPQVNELITQIREALTEEQGWNGLFFFGHSDKGSLTGGELAIAPNTWITISQIQEQLLKAKKQGLQFALFNSCNGLDIAGKLIDLGLSQVIVMREPIHNSVAQEFLKQFLKKLGDHRDVHDAMIAVTQEMKVEYKAIYPSAGLIPTIFCAQDAEKFSLPKQGLWEFLRLLVPSRREAITLFSLLTLSLIPDLQGLLLESRLGMQALYRSLTEQIPSRTAPPVLLVQIDQESLYQEKITVESGKPLDRSYLAKILKNLPTSPFTVIGIDYVFDSTTVKDKPLITAVQELVKQGNKIILATDGANKTVKIEELVGQWSYQADAYFDLFGDIELPSEQPKCPEECPFAFMLGLVHTLQTSSASFQLQRHSGSNIDLGSQLFAVLQKHPQSNVFKFWKASIFPLGLQPIVDFSIPPSQIYESVPAWQILEQRQRMNVIKNLVQPKIIILAAGEYEQAHDNWQLPLALQFWHQQIERAKTPPIALTGGKVHAYMLHHLLSQHFVIPIPDLWMVGVAVIIGKGAQIVLRQNRSVRQWQNIGLFGGVVFYGLAGLQVFVVYGILLPWFLPSTAAWMYLYLPLEQSKRR